MEMTGSAAFLRSPFPYFGGKRRVADEVWRRFGNVPNYCEPFFGSGAVLLGRPRGHTGAETVNDLNGWLTNFWRAVQQDPEGVARYADYPVSELDMHARGDWLFYRRGVVPDFVERLRADPEYYDVKSAGWWVWGQCAWIAGGWCREEKRAAKNTAAAAGGDVVPVDVASGEDVASPDATEVDVAAERDGAVTRGLPSIGGARGVNRVTRGIPSISDGGQGVHHKIPLAGGGRGINAGDERGIGHSITASKPMGVHRKLPSADSMGVHSGGGGLPWGEDSDTARMEWLRLWFTTLAVRLRETRIVCGDWGRITTPSTTWHVGVPTAVFLDPPYSLGEHTVDYGEHTTDCAAEVRAWAIENGGDPRFRIALCGYDGEHEMPADWYTFKWAATGGYGLQGEGKGRANRLRERIWFSPHCLGSQQDLFDMAGIFGAAGDAPEEEDAAPVGAALTLFGDEDDDDDAGLDRECVVG